MPTVTLPARIETNPYYVAARRSIPPSFRLAATLPGAVLFAVLTWAALRHVGPVGATEQTLGAAFSLEGWLEPGLALLSLPSHWLVPPIVRRALAAEPLSRELPEGFGALIPPSAAVEGRARSVVDALRGGLASFLPVLPLALLVTPGYLPAITALLLGALLWGRLVAASTAWSIVSSGRQNVGLRGFLLQSVLLPTSIAIPALVLARGCSHGLAHPELVFWTVAGGIAMLLMLGAAAAFWDCAQRRLNPSVQRSLWFDPSGPSFGPDEQNNLQADQKRAGTWSP
jgi:hypothetical protein